MASILTTVRDLERLRQIVAVLVRHGFGELVQRSGLSSLLQRTTPDESISRRSTAERIRLVLEDLGPSFVKLGQLLSTRPDLLPEDILNELKKLQEQARPLSFDVIKTSIEQELGTNLNDIFVSFDETPLASASIAQVHRAELKTDHGIEQVVVKVQRPNIEQLIRRDLDLLFLLARTIDRSMVEFRPYSPIKLVAEFARGIEAELDFGREADHIEKFLSNFSQSTEVKFPRVFRQTSSRRILVLEFLDGIRLLDAPKHNFEGKALAKLAVGIVVKQIFEDGFFHADPHPGNILILGTPETPIVGLLDLGLVGQLTPRLRDKTVDLMIAAASNDHRGIADALYAMSRRTRSIDRIAYETDIAHIASRYLGKRLRDIPLPSLVRDLVRCATVHGLEIPSDFALVGKTLVTLEGIGRDLDPELDIFEASKPYFLALAKERYSPDRLRQDALRTMARLSVAATDVPLQLQDILEDLRHARLTLRLREPDLTRALQGVGSALVSGLFGLGCLLSGSYLIAHQRIALGYTLIGISALMGIFFVSFGRPGKKTKK